MMGDYMKISIITLHNIKNYGSALQTYATQCKFEQYGMDVEIVDFNRKGTSDDELLEALVKRSKFGKNFFTRILYREFQRPNVKKGCSVFNEFLKKYINLTPNKYHTLAELRANIPSADIYCTGSDQVWNSGWNEGILEEFFLEYAPKGSRCITYASSIGKDKLDDWELNRTKELLRKYNAISVREASAVKILSDMSIKSVQVIDPTLILDTNQWEKIIDKPVIKEKYILVYQLYRNKQFDKYANAVAKKMGYKLVRISYKYDQLLKKGKFIWMPKVTEFLSLFYNAEFVITDSFHGTAFSINFNKKFISIYPYKYSGRISSILKLTGLEERHLSDYKDFEIINKEIDYKRVNEILSNERKKTDQFLKFALKSAEEQKKC